ncbi:TAXI family TRAP transporter solute-binding subunit [Paralimibaculum aggregatum]|uniref:TAXI family TRAP transporter solute-binding subunit n=1 Tax=Paralimibaculum aggregatum TaxID=3036245 RepID=A0ABQ6LRR7_9RHOB|nr:TAXI family TRAP transporter solute-binding subunit [Limibaculum sp. NKW23]GMG84299.1 TAXI family TRAP transporter solute-binding subunit [Limibaculum sp. NKW23]
MNKAVTLAALGLCAVLGLSQEAGAKDRIAFGTTALSSVHYTYSVAAAKAINEHESEALDVTVISTGGAVDNLQRIRRDQIDMGLGTYATIYQAYKGIGKFEGNAMPELRALWVHAPALQAWVVREDSGVSDLQGLAGQPFTPGQRGSATEQLVIQMLEALEIEPDMQRLSLADAVDAVKDNRSIGYAKAGGTASLDGTTLELQTFTPIRLLSFSEAEVETVRAALPFIAFRSYADGEVAGFGAFTAPVQVIGQFTTASAMTDAQVEAVLTAIVDDTEIQANAFPGFAKLDVARDSVALVSIPLHAGAVKFYRSRGIEVPEALIPPEMQ